MRTARPLSSLAAATLAVCSLVSPSARGADASVAANRPTAQIDDATLERLLKLHHQEQETVRLVQVPASVVDRRGRIVRGLEREDFRLFEDQVPQEIEYFSVESGEPVSIAFLVDLSSSMRQLGRLDEAKHAIRYLVDSLRYGDRFALIGFADEQVSWITEFTHQKNAFIERLDVQEAYGQTALNDAVAATPRLVDESVRGRKAIVLITDGVDNASELSAGEAIDIARRVNVPIYTIGFTGLREDLRPKAENAQTNLAVLKWFSRETGGAMFPVYDPDELKEAVARVDEDLRHQYLIGYTPTSAADGSFRRIRLETRNGRLLVRTRRGYYATAD